MSKREEKSYCRVCWAFCGTTVLIEEDRVVRVRGDRTDPVSRGYVCFKGLQAPEQHNSEKRLRRSLRRIGDTFEEGDSNRLMAEAGERLKQIVAEHGPESVGIFTGTQTFMNAVNAQMAAALAMGLGTPRMFTTMTIDQSAKWIAEQRMGAWVAGPQAFADSDVWMFIGANPLVSMSFAGGADGMTLPHPVDSIKQARARGMKIIVIDPRRSETAQLADLFLQPRPGRDAELIASILHCILRENWHDEEFCRDFVDGVDELRSALEPFAPEVCAPVIGVSAQDIEAAAAMFARDARTGMAGSGTGPNMARHSNLAEHLIEALNVVCGRFPREGEAMPNPGVLMRGRSPRAGVRLPAEREWESGPKTRKHQLGRIKGTMMSTAIADEILHPGPDRMRALICIGGNPAVALPDQAKAEAALRALDLLIVIDPRMTATARFADYVFAPKLHYERPDHTGTLERLFQHPIGHVTPALVPPPAGSDVVDDWLPLWWLAKCCDVPLQINGRDVPMDTPPRAEELFALQTAGAPVEYSVVAAERGTRLFEREPVLIGPSRNDTRFQLTPADVLDEIQVLASELGRAAAPTRNGNEFQLTVRRHRETINSTAADFDATWARIPGNPAYLHPSDLSRLGVEPGDLVHVVRGQARLTARAAADEGLRPGVVSMGHARPGIASRPWEATNALVDDDREVQAINRMPIMTGMTVTVERGQPDAMMPNG
ncbi:molybdopterin-containing oxidoreductase family protein [Mycolicibacterium thermoresistibile]